MKISWVRDLGSPTEPGEFFVKSINGYVRVTQEEIDASKLGENPDVEVSEITSQGHNVRKFILGQFIPKQNKDEIWEFIKNKA